MLNKFTQYSARFYQFYTRFFLIVDADDFFLAFETNCTEFRHALFPRERDLYTHESNGNVRTYENQAALFYVTKHFTCRLTVLSMKCVFPHGAVSLESEISAYVRA